VTGVLAPGGVADHEVHHEAAEGLRLLEGDGVPAARRQHEEGVRTDRGGQPLAGIDELGVVLAGHHEHQHLEVPHLLPQRELPSGPEVPERTRQAGGRV